MKLCQNAKKLDIFSVLSEEKKWQCNFVLCHLLYPSPNFHFYVQSSLKFFGEKTKSSEMCYSASGSNQSYKHPASCLECVNRGKMIFCFCCCYYLVSSNNVNSVMSPITSGMHHIACQGSMCLGGSPWHCRAPTVLIRVHVSWWHQPTALTYVLYLQSSITALSSQQSENMDWVLNGLSWSSSCL